MLEFESSILCAMIGCVVAALVLQKRAGLVTCVFNFQPVGQACLKKAPAGPTTLEDLCAWPEQFCQRLFSDQQHGEDYQASFKRLFANYNFRVHDSYAGTGNASTALKKALLAFCAATGQAWRPHAAITASAIERDRIAQRVLANLHEAWATWYVLFQTQIWMLFLQPPA